MDPSSFDLVRSKLDPPAARRGIVARTPLLDRLVAAASSAVVSVVAPAGYGKTTFLAQWAESKEPRVGWVSVDDRDNDPVVLLSYIAMALDRIEAIDPRVFRALSSSGAGREGPRWLVAAMARMRQPGALVIDNLEVVTNPESLDAVAALALGLPMGWSLPSVRGPRCPCQPDRRRGPAGAHLRRDPRRSGDRLQPPQHDAASDLRRARGHLRPRPAAASRPARPHARARPDGLQLRPLGRAHPDAGDLRVDPRADRHQRRVPRDLAAGDDAPALQPRSAAQRPRRQRAQLRRHLHPDLAQGTGGLAAGHPTARPGDARIPLLRSTRPLACLGSRSCSPSWPSPRASAKPSPASSAKTRSPAHRPLPWATRSSATSSPQCGNEQADLPPPGRAVGEDRDG